MPFAFLADLPADALGAISAVSLGVGAGAAFLAVPLVIFLADGKGFPFWMVDASSTLPAIHLLYFFYHKSYLVTKK